MLRYADAIVKRGVDRLTDAIAHSAEPQTINADPPSSKNAWVTTLTAHRKQLTTRRTAVLQNKPLPLWTNSATCASCYMMK